MRLSHGCDGRGFALGADMTILLNPHETVKTTRLLRSRSDVGCKLAILQGGGTMTAFVSSFAAFARQQIVKKCGDARANGSERPNPCEPIGEQAKH
jgi:hypothetical protein